MSITAGALSKVLIGASTAQLSSAAASGGTAPYTYQWYRSQTTGFSPGPSNILTGQTSLTLNDSGLTPGQTYFYVVVATDSVAATANSAQLTVVMEGAQSPNQFVETPVIGMPDLKFNYDTVSAMIDASQVGVLPAGQAVKLVDSAAPLPQVVACAANSDEVFGFISYDIKSQGYVAGDRCEIASGGNVIFLQATAAIARGAQVQLDLTYIGGVATKTGSSGANIVGYAYDKAVGVGIIRVKLATPSFQFA